MKSIKVTGNQLEILASALYNRQSRVHEMMEIFKKSNPGTAAIYMEELNEIQELQKMLQKKLAA